MDEVTTYYRPDPADVEETERILYGRIGAVPPPLHKKVPAEFAAQAVVISEDRPSNDMALDMARLSKAGCQAALTSVRLLKDLRDKIHLLEHSVVGIQDSLDDLLTLFPPEQLPMTAVEG